MLQVLRRSVTRRAVVIACVALGALAPSAGARDVPDAPRQDAPSARFSWPITPHPVLRRFDPPEVRWGSGHRGVDLGATPGEPITAPSEGVVTFAGTVAGRGVLTLHHPEGFDTTYEPVSHQLSAGTRVERGDWIAVVAQGGHCAASCLHWGYRVGDGVYRDPLTLVAGIRPVLLPLV